MTDASGNLDQAIQEITISTGKYLTFKLAEESYGIGIVENKRNH